MNSAFPPIPQLLFQFHLTRLATCLLAHQVLVARYWWREGAVVNNNLVTSQGKSRCGCSCSCWITCDYGGGSYVAAVSVVRAGYTTQAACEGAFDAGASVLTDIVKLNSNYTGSSAYVSSGRGMCAGLIAAYEPCTVCDSCEPGYYCPGGSTTTQGAGQCAAGRYGPAGNSSDQGAGQCAAGRYCPAGSGFRRKWI